MPEVNRVEHSEEQHVDPVDGSVHEVSTTTEAQQGPPAPPAVVERSETVTTAPAGWMERRRYALMRVTQIIWLITGIIEAIIGIRFVLKLIAANPNAGYAQFIYGISAPFLVPFYNLTATPSAFGSVLEIWDLIAMLVYALIAWGIVKLVWILFYKPPAGSVP